MATLILAIIYAAFISLGLPDGMLGAAWPAIQGEFAVPLGWAGLVSLVISGGTILSSLLSSRLLRRFGTGKVTLCSVLLTAIALAGFSRTGQLWTVLLCAVPLGIGAGAVDAGLNGYVAEHYRASQMNFLHAFWGIGALSGPLVMSLCMRDSGNWRHGYGAVAVVQAALVVILFLTLPLWKKAERSAKAQPEPGTVSPAAEKRGFMANLRVRGVRRVLVCFMMYTGIEATLGLWGASYLARIRHFAPAQAAAWVSIYYGGITAGRLACGFLAMRFTGRQLVRSGEILIGAGVSFMILGQFLPAGDALTIGGFILAGLGCAPVFPGMLHETPVRFGRENAQAVMGFQMAVAYASTTLLPPLFGLAATASSPVLLPWILAVYISVLFFLSEQANRLFPLRTNV